MPEVKIMKGVLLPPMFTFQQVGGELLLWVLFRYEVEWEDGKKEILAFPLHAQQAETVGMDLVTRASIGCVVRDLAGVMGKGEDLVEKAGSVVEMLVGDGKWKSESAEVGVVGGKKERVQ